MPCFTEASFKRNRVSKLSVPSRMTLKSRTRFSALRLSKSATTPSTRISELICASFFSAATAFGKLAAASDSSKSPCRCLVIEENGIAKSTASFNLSKEITGNNALILKLEKKGSLYTAYYSLDGVKFDKLGVANILLKDIKAGLIACDGVIIQSMKNTFWFDSDTTKPNTPFDVSFDYFRITNTGIK